MSMTDDKRDQTGPGEAGASGRPDAASDLAARAAAAADAARAAAPEATAPETAEPGDVADAAQGESPQTDPLEAKVSELEAERDELKSRLMYALAELENVRKRAERDRRDAETFGGQRLARDLLTVHDNLARALEAADDGLRESHAGFLEGVELTQRELLNAFGKHKIEKLAPEPGAAFDPNFHQAMFEAPVPGAEPGSVIEVMQAGFTIAGRLLRPALVGVAKEAPAAAAGGEG